MPETPGDHYNKSSQMKDKKSTKCGEVVYLHCGERGRGAKQLREEEAEAPVTVATLPRTALSRGLPPLLLYSRSSLIKASPSIQYHFSHHHSQQHVTPETLSLTLAAARIEVEQEQEDLGAIHSEIQYYGKLA